MPRNVLIMDVLDALFRLVVGCGDLAPSLRALAADAGMSPAGVVHHFGSRQHALHLAVARWSKQRAEDLPWCGGPEDLVRLLPEREDQVHDAAFDLALIAMGRGDEGIARSMAELRRARRLRLQRAVPHLDDAWLDLVVAALARLLELLPLEPSEPSEPSERASAS